METILPRLSNDHYVSDVDDDDYDDDDHGSQAARACQLYDVHVVDDDEDDDNNNHNDDVVYDEAMVSTV